MRQESKQDRRHRRSRWAGRFEALEPRLCLSLDVPAFSSLAGANHTIYLDFDGHVTPGGTAWDQVFGPGGVNSPSYSIDADHANFSATELANIQTIWKRVSEDYMPFQVNVTTVFPGIEALRKIGGGDTQWGIRVVITDDTENTGTGGIAFLNSFNWNSDTPCFVYEYDNSPKTVAEGVAHEAGHTLGLEHDGRNAQEYYAGHGSGETGWAPIMGFAKSKSLSTWDKGEYSGHTNTGPGSNAGHGADDLAVIAGFNGFGYRSDDHGDTNATSTAMTAAGTSVSASGFIGRPTDIDVFRFTTGAGQVTLSALNFSVGPNLDIKADLYNAAGSLVASSNSTSVTDATITANLAAGTYYLHIDGTGWGNPAASPPTGYSDHGSLGQYTISGTIVEPAGGGVLISVADVAKNENTAKITFKITLSAPAAQNVKVSYATADGTAIAGSDYIAKSGVLTFLPGEVSKNLNVTLITDTVSEPFETFFLNLSNPTGGATISDSQAIGTINNDDALFSITDVSLTEQDPTGFRKFTFKVTLLHPTANTPKINYQTLDGTATVADNDYVTKSGLLKFTNGAISKNVVINVVKDNLAEADETFIVLLTNPVNGTIADDTGVGTILDDDTAGRPTRGDGEGGEPLAARRFDVALELRDGRIYQHTWAGQVTDFLGFGRVDQPLDPGALAWVTDRADSAGVARHIRTTAVVDMATALDETPNWTLPAAVTARPDVRVVDDVATSRVRHRAEVWADLHGMEQFSVDAVMAEFESSVDG